MAITLPIIKYELVVNGVKTDVTKDISSWAEIATKMEREEAGGIIKTKTVPLHFRRNAQQIVLKLYEEKGNRAEAVLNVYIRENHGNKYNLDMSIDLDFSTFKRARDLVELTGFKNTLSEYLSANGRTNYDIPVSEVSDALWDYGRVKLLNIGNYIATPDTNVIILPLDTYRTFYVYNVDNEMTPGGTEHHFQSQDGDSTDVNSNYFFEAQGNVTIKLRIDAEFRARLNRQCTVVLLKNGIETGYKWDIDKDVVGLDNMVYVDIDTTIYLALIKGDRLTLAVYSPQGQSSAVWVEKSRTFTLTYEESGVPILNVDVINPKRLLQKYLDLITEQDGLFTSDIEWSWELPCDFMLCAAESIRGFENANVHGSINDFIDTMKGLGYEYHFTNNSMIFKPRDEFYQRNKIAMKLGVREARDLVEKADNSYAYTGVKIGFEKQDYESVNGRCEANGTFDYTTGYKKSKDNILELVLPYRGDSIGIELLFGQRYNKTTDTQSDNDIFIIAMNHKYTSPRYTEYRSEELVDNITGLRMFNAPLSPYYLVKYNESLIGINTDTLTFAGTDTNKEAEIRDYNWLEDPKDIYQNQTITKHLFRPHTFNFEVGTLKPLPSKEYENGVIEFIYGRETYYGYIQDIVRNYGTDESTTWTLRKAY